MNFKKYIHIERFGTNEVEGIDVGVCEIQPKLDGSNASCWMYNGELYTGSRNRLLSLDNDNAGFCRYVTDNKEQYQTFLDEHPTKRLYMEWLVPSSLKTYRKDTWKKAWIFDIYDDEINQFIPFEIYKDWLEKLNFNIIYPLATFKNPTTDQLQRLVESNTFLIEDGKGAGEGIVIRNHEFRNRYGRICWAKIVRNEFKEMNKKSFGVPVLGEKSQVENDFAEKYVTEAFVDKTKAKIELLLKEEIGEIPRAKLIPRLLETVYYDLINEEIYHFIKDKRNPVINFKTLYQMIVYQTKQKAKDLF